MPLYKCCTLSPFLLPYKYGTKKQITKIAHSADTKTLGATLFESHRGFIFISSVIPYFTNSKSLLHFLQNQLSFTINALAPNVASMLQELK